MSRRDYLLLAIAVGIALVSALKDTLAGDGQALPLLVMFLVLCFLAGGVLVWLIGRRGQ
jgi:hypothetical protein